jgi:uncharacterized protein YneF (UPF0154 family)
MRRLVLALVALLAVAGGAYIASRLLAEPPSDEERIRTLFAEAARAAEERRIGDAVEGVSERFSGQGLDKRGVKQLVALEVLRGAWVSVTVAGAEVQVEGDAASATVDLVLARSGAGKAIVDLLPGEASAHRIDCRLEREEGTWRIVSAAWRPIGLAEAAAGPGSR